MIASTILAISFWVVLYSIAVVRIVASRCSREMLCERVFSALPIVMGLSTWSAVSGFVSSGQRGLLGNGVAGLLWWVWCALMWLPKHISPGKEPADGDADGNKKS